MPGPGGDPRRPNIYGCVSPAKVHATGGCNGRHKHPLLVEVDVRPRHRCGLIPVPLALLNTHIDMLSLYRGGR